jgi:hypothetical protein
MQDRFGLVQVIMAQSSPIADSEGARNSPFLLYILSMALIFDPSRLSRGLLLVACCLLTNRHQQKQQRRRGRG